MRVLIVGCGYVGLPLGAELVRSGHEVFGLRRNASAEGELKAAGIKLLTADITRPSELAQIPAGHDWVVNCVSSTGGGVEGYRAVYLEGMQNLLKWLAASRLEKFVYTNSTSVYGQTDGSIVVETSPTEPDVETARILLQTEQILLKAAQQTGFPSVVLRVAGIYGPERGYWLRQYLNGEAVLEGEGEQFLNMIHRDDVIGATIAALQRGRAGEVYNAVDDEPVSQLALFQWLAARLGKDLPPRTPLPPAASRRRALTNKRVSNSKLKEELDYQFKYPTFRQGFEAELARLGGIPNPEGAATKPKIRNPKSEIRNNH
jgi:nucleoside-diphosphate-sugar epimerase